MATYISTVSLKAREFIKNIVKCEGSPLFSKFYTFQVTFNQDGICFVDGIIWPERFKDYNCLGEEGVLLETLCESISTSSNAEVLEKQFDSQKHPFENGSSFQANDIRSSIDNCFYNYTIQHPTRC